MTDFFDDLERELRRAHRPDTASRARSRLFDRRRLPSVPARRLLSVPLAAAAAVGVVVVVLAGLGAIDKNDADRRPQPVGTVPAPSMEVVADAIDVERGMHLGLDGPALTVELLPPVSNQTSETVEGARISATCGAPPGDPRGEITLTRLWPGSQTSMSFRFPRDVSRWCRLEDQSGNILASVTFPGPGVPPGTREQITETANNWARVFASTAQACNDYTSRTVCEQVKRDCQGDGETSIEACSRSQKARQWAAEHRGREGREDRHQRRPSARHIVEPQHGPAATHRHGRVADRQARPARGCGLFRVALGTTRRSAPSGSVAARRAAP